MHAFKSILETGGADNPSSCEQDIISDTVNKDISYYGSVDESSQNEAQENDPESKAPDTARQLLTEDIMIQPQLSTKAEEI